MLSRVLSEENPLTLTRWSAQPSRRKANVARAHRVVIACVVTAAVLAGLLLVNSIVDYRYVSRLLTVQQVRRDLDEVVVALERKLRQVSPVDEASLPQVIGQVLQEESQEPLWVELRRPDGSVIVRRGLAGPRQFTGEEESQRFRNRDPLFKVVALDGREVVVEAFPLRAVGIGGPPPAAGLPPPGLPVAAGPPPTAAAAAPPATPPGAGPPPPAQRRPQVTVEIAAPLEVRDASVIWRVRRNLLINVSGALALLLAAMAAGFGFRTYIRGQRLEEQLVIAREVQTELLPAPTDSWKEVGLSTVYQPADQVSGDFYDGFRSPDGRIALVMGDVSGKGVPAALVMGVIHGAVRSSSWVGSAEDHERESARLNELLCEKSSGARFASMFWGYYDSSARRLCYVNAGHCPPLIAATRDGRIDVTRLPATGTVLGLIPGTPYAQASVTVSPGDVLVLYSDGLVEAANGGDEEYGEDRLREALAASGGGEPERVRDAILASVNAFVGATPLRDDLTLVVAKLA